MNKPKVSILCLTYNHEKFIKKALDSFLEQKTNFNFEVLIHDDASTDKTIEILKQYQKKYPKIIKPIFEKENQYSKGFRGFTSKILLPLAKGKYIALCEGDDYFINKNKLQLQADFLDNHPDYSLCFYPVKVFFENNEEKEYIFPNQNLKKFNLNKLLENNFIQTSSVMYRRQDYKKLPQTNILPGDWFLHLYHAKFGKIGFINKIMSVYRRHPNGLWWNSTKNRNQFLIEHGVEQLMFYLEVIKLFNFDTKKTEPTIINIKNLLEEIIKTEKKYNLDILNKYIINNPKEICLYFRDYLKYSHKNSLNDKIKNKYKKLKIETVNLKTEINRLKNDLNRIQISKTYKIWQKFCNTRKKIKYFLKKYENN